MKALLFLLALASAFGGQSPAEDYSVSGVVVDHVTNRPLNHVLVQLARISKGGGDVSVITAEDGRFNFLHVPKGKYQLQAEKRGQMPVQFGQSDGGYASAIVVDGTMKTDNIVFALRSDAHIDGTVISEGAEPLRNAQLLLFRETVTEGEAQTVQMAGTNTNSSGHFHFGHLEPGKYYVCVSVMPWFPQFGLNQNHELVYPITFYGDVTDAKGARAILLTEGGSASIQIDIRPVPGIHVRIPEATRGVQLFVPGPGDSQIPIPVQYGQQVSGGAVRPRALKPPNANGQIEQPPDEPEEQTMELVNLPAGRYKAAMVSEYGGFSQTSEAVDLTDGSTLDLAQLRSSSIGGKILFNGIEPRGRLELFLGSHGPGGMNTEVGVDGAFHFEKVSPGSYDLNLTDPGMVISSISAKGANVVHDRLEVPPGATVELILRVMGSTSLSTVEGFAVREGHGMAGAMVLLIPQDLTKSRLIRRDQSDADGSFSLPNVAPGRYTLVAIDDGHDLAYKTASVIAPYLRAGLVLTTPLGSSDPVRVFVQARIPQ